MRLRTTLRLSTPRSGLVGASPHQHFGPLARGSDLFCSPRSSMPRGRTTPPHVQGSSEPLPTSIFGPLAQGSGLFWKREALRDASAAVFELLSAAAGAGVVAADFLRGGGLAAGLQHGIEADRRLAVSIAGLQGAGPTGGRIEANARRARGAAFALVAIDFRR